MSASDSSLVPAGVTQTRGMLGPGLTLGMGEASLVAALNAWGTARDQDLLDRKADLSATQVGVSGAFSQAQETLQGIVSDFRNEAEAMRQLSQHEAAQSLARLELVVGEARSRFDLQDGRFAEGLSELARRLEAVDTWAQAEPQRVAAQVAATVPTSPGGTPLAMTAFGWRHPAAPPQQQQQPLPQQLQPPGLAAPQPQQPPWTQPQLQPLWTPGAQPQQQQPYFDSKAR